MNASPAATKTFALGDKVTKIYVYPGKPSGFYAVRAMGKVTNLDPMSNGLWLGVTLEDGSKTMVSLEDASNPDRAEAAMIKHAEKISA